MQRHFHEELDALKQTLLAMGGLVEDQIRRVMRALIERDSELAQEVIDRDRQVNAYDVEIDEKCVELLALHQPTAGDLRFITTTLKIVTDLERIGDQAVNIAQRALELNREPQLKPYVDLPRMAERAQRMVKESLDAFVSRDTELARRVCGEDADVDALKEQVFRELLTFMMEDPRTIPRAIRLILISRFLERVADHATNIAEMVLVQQGAELAYLLRHDPEFRRVRAEHLVEAGRRVRLKKDIKHFVEFLERGAEGVRFSFFVVSAAPKAVVQAALEGIVPPDHIYGTEFDYDPSSGEICAIAKAPAGDGTVAIAEELEATLQTSPHRTIYVGDGNSDVHVMLRVNNRGGFTIAVSEEKYMARIAKRTVVSDNALSVLVPILEDVMGWDAVRIRELFESYGLVVQEWDKARTDWVTIREDSTG